MKAKRIVINALILMLCVILFGCRDIDLRSSTVINENGTGLVKLQILYDDFISSKLEKDIIDHEWVKENGYQFNKYLANNMHVEEITYRFKNIKELEQKINSSGLATMIDLKEMKGRDNIYTIDLKFNKLAIDNLIKNNTDDEKIYNYIKTLKFINEVKVPGDVIKSNAPEDVGENTKVWTYKVNQIDNDTNIIFSYKITNSMFSVV